MIPGQYFIDEGDLPLNPGRPTVDLTVSNAADRRDDAFHSLRRMTEPYIPQFDRAAARGMRLNIASGTAIRFEPGQQRKVQLVAYQGERQVFGFRAQVQGALDVKKESP